MQAKNIVIVVLVLALIGAVVYLFMNSGSDTVVVDETPATPDAEQPIPVEPDGGIGDGAGPIPEEPVAVERGDETFIGVSAAGTNITAYHFGTGDTEILLVGGVHGGYSPNTTALTKELVSYFETNEAAIPGNVMVTVIPNLNPDGSTKAGAAGRFNGNDVDLNRNFDCEWAANAVWQQQEVSGGSAPFSEPEAMALRDYVLTYDPAAAVVWFSAEGKVYPSACADTPSRSSVALAATFATAAGYPAEAEFDAYAINGDMVNWMAAQDIPAISVLLSDHQGTEWSKNKAGIEAVLSTYAD